MEITALNSSEGHSPGSKSTFHTGEHFQMDSTRGWPVHRRDLHSLNGSLGNCPYLVPVPCAPALLRSYISIRLNCYLTIPQPFPTIASMLLRTTGFTNVSRSMNSFEASVEQMQESCNLFKNLHNRIFLNILISFVMQNIKIKRGLGSTWNLFNCILYNFVYAIKNLIFYIKQKPSGYNCNHLTRN